MGKGNDVKFYLHDLKHVNTVLGLLYDENGKYRAGFKPEEFYNTILLDTLKYGEENYVHLKYAETVNISKSQSVARFRRWAGMTPVIRPMVEGMPPAPDKHSYEYMEVGNVFSFGRWSEYTDQIDMSVVSDLIAERSSQYGENANQTKELYARKEWLSSPNEFYANFKSIDTIGFGDAITIDDLRFLTMRMKRAQVKPIGGKFNYICSQEFINGLIDDPRVKAYMEINQTTGNMWTTGEAVPLFDLNFIPTMLDEFAYPDTEFPGVYEGSDGKEIMRLYAKGQFTISGTATDVIVYADIKEDYVVKSGVTAKTVANGVTYLNDGTAVENKEAWEFPAGTAGTDFTALSGRVSATTADASHIRVRYSTVERKVDDHGLSYYKYGPLTDATSYVSTIEDLFEDGAFMQLPIHRGILFGDEGMIKINKEGLSDAPRIIIKALGSSGIIDPLDQRQSVGYRVDGFGLAIKRPEAICVTYGIPTNAEFAYLSAAYVQSAAKGALEYNGEYVQDVAGNNIQATVVDAVNNPYDVSIGTALVDAMNKYVKFSYKSSYDVDDKIQYKGVPYVVTSAITAKTVTKWTSASAHSVGAYVSNDDKIYKVITAITSSDTTFPTTSVVEVADMDAEAFDKSKVKKDADRLFANLYELANKKNSNVR